MKRRIGYTSNPLRSGATEQHRDNNGLAKVNSYPENEVIILLV